MKISLKIHILAFAVCALLVLISYRFIDKPVVFFAYTHHFRQFIFHHKGQQVLEHFVLLVPFAFSYYGYRLFRKLTTNFDKFIFLLTISLLTAFVIKHPLKFIFGRYWPATFHGKNISLLHDGAYGFNFFTGGFTYQSFPSGHTLEVVSVATILWFYCPRWRWFAILISLMVSTSLIVWYYHFVSDVIAGAFLGYLNGITVIKFNQKWSDRLSRSGKQKKSNITKMEEAAASAQ